MPFLPQPSAGSSAHSTAGLTGVYAVPYGYQTSFSTINIHLNCKELNKKILENVQTATGMMYYLLLDVFVDKKQSGLTSVQDPFRTFAR